MVFSLVAAREAAGFTSNTALAERVLPLWKKRDRKAKYGVKEFAAVIGRIERKPVWWRKRPHAAAALAEALGIEVTDFPLAVPSRRGHDRALFAFEDLPELRALDLAVETPCRAVVPEWWAPERLVMSARTWILAPPGAGRSLLGRWCDARGGWRVLKVRRLEDAVEVALAEKDCAVFVDVEAPDATTDARAADALLSCARPVVVAATFDVAVGDVGRERAKAEAQPRRSIFPSSSGAQIDEAVALAELWGRQAWTLPRGWRSRFAAWVAERLEQASPAKVDEIAAWLDEEDLDSTLWSTPGDLLPLLGWALLEGNVRRLKRADLARTWLRGRLQRAAPDGSDRAAWLRAAAEPALLAMVAGRLADVVRPWDAPLTRDEWAALVPTSVAPRAAIDGLVEKIEKVAALPKKADRAREARELAAETGRSTALLAIDHLVAAELLRLASSGVYALYPRWVATWWAAEQAKIAVRDDTPARWGRLAMEKSRRRFFDEALDALDEKSLSRTIDVTLKTFNADDLGAAGAIEALFAAAARRLERGDSLDVRRAHALWAQQFALFVRRVEWRPPEPLTRVSLWDTPAEVDWICCMWAFSLGVSRPKAPPPGYEWLLPGWFETRIADMPDWIGRYVDDDRIPVAARNRMFKLLITILPECKDTEFPNPEKHYHYLGFAGELTVLADERGWSLPPEFAAHMLFQHRSDGRARWIFEQLPEPDQKRIAANLFQLASRDKQWGSWLMTRLHRDHRNWWDFMATRLSDDTIETLARDGIIGGEQLKEVETWPANLWLAAARGVISSGRADRLLELLADNHEKRRWAAGVLPVVDALLQVPSVDAWKRVRLMEIVWELDPNRALEHVRASYPQDENAQHWFQRGEDGGGSLLLGVLEERGTSPAWVQPWLARQLPRNALDADRIYRLLRQAQAGT